jgi:hypothetical protein
MSSVEQMLDPSSLRGVKRRSNPESFCRNDWIAARDDGSRQTLALIASSAIRFVEAGRPSARSRASLTRTLLAKRVEYNSVRPMVVLAGDYDRTTFAVVIS